ncbi:retroviral-like aspartic protease family protein [Sphingomonas sp. G-3-2-10]|uniref:retroviral-like aspartic protease family protein n=1 Tax=Sphingomonas sp. G-3-2-10 TaxID=2728838 RepID=UPI00146E81AD|nr:retroviral-like aspartic protease family protein [Sphingomonas sp. G-3-2-10]NML08292.1 hypothetical protein [Sphingomonas sp. G-3-2-10]
MRNILVSACALALASPACAQSLEVLPSGHPVAQVSIDGAPPKRFVIDTAASSTVILPRLRAELPTMPVTMQGVSGAAGSAQVEVARIDRLQVDGRTFRDRPAILLPPGPVDALGVDGILGADVIADFAVEMDIPGRRWRMADRAAPEMLRGLPHSVAFTLDDQRAPRLTVRLNGVEVPAILDTGARGTIVNWAAAARIGLTPQSEQLRPASDVRGATSHGTASVKVRLDMLGIGEARIAAPEVRIADLPVFGVVGFKPGEPAVILGIDMFADRRFVIDHPGLRLHVSDPVAPHAG